MDYVFVYPNVSPSICPIPCKLVVHHVVVFCDDLNNDWFKLSVRVDSTSNNSKHAAIAYIFLFLLLSFIHVVRFFSVWLHFCCSRQCFFLTYFTQWPNEIKRWLFNTLSTMMTDITSETDIYTYVCVDRHTVGEDMRSMRIFCE